MSRTALLRISARAAAACASWRAQVRTVLAARALAFAALLVLQTGGAFAQANTDRPGGDMQPPITLEFKQGSFLTFEAECEGICKNNGLCRAWTMVKPGVQGPKARCYLKDRIPAARANNCCVSGAKGNLAGLEPGTNRPNKDIRNFPVGNADLRDQPELACKVACEKEPQCRAWTYVWHGKGNTGHCWLKNPAPAAVPDQCCISGVVSRPDPQVAADMNPSGKTIAQCEEAFARNSARCTALGFQAKIACDNQAIQIRGACISLAAQAAGGGTTPTPGGGGSSSTILNYAKNAFGKCVDRDLKVRSAACPPLPIGQVGHGECTDLVNGAIVSAGFSKISGYVWGTKVGDNNTADKSVFRPGDIIQLFNYKLVNPANTGNYSESSSQHSAIIESNSGGVLTVLEQNTNSNGENRRYVTRGTYNLNWRLERGSYIVYRK